MNAILSLLCSAILLATSGCETAPTPGASAPMKIDYGTHPDNFEQIIKDHFAKTLYEASTAQYRFGKPFAGHMKGGPLLGRNAQEAGYFVEVWLTAKDRSGAYLPERRLGALIKNGEVLIELSPSELDGAVRAP